MLIIFRHDSTTQVIIHTANMIAFDWANMTQGLWKSPLLPELKPSQSEPLNPKIGTGVKFKIDLLNYLRAYDTRRVICKPLIEQLSKYDFSEIRAALVASVPGRQGIETDSKTVWGWAGLAKVLSCVPVTKSESEIVIQISSIATLGVNDKWLDKTLFKALSTSKGNGPNRSNPKFRIIFPTADEIRRSLNGYKSGSAIHTKIQTAAQQKQLAYLKPLLYHWAGDGAHHTLATPSSDACRKRAAPHIKTFVRFSDPTFTSIDWMLVTSANLSKQAWGEATNSAGEIRICSYEIGVMVWPELFGESAEMVPTFKADKPELCRGKEVGKEVGKDGEVKVVVGARMPYDIPLVKYGRDDVPWCASASYTETDWMGETWNV